MNSDVTWTQFHIGEEFILNGVRLAIASITTSRIVLRPIGPPAKNPYGDNRHARCRYAWEQRGKHE